MDSLKIAESTDSLCFDHFLISDQNIDVPNTWTLIQISRKFDSPAVENRYYKMGVPTIFDDYDYSIYLDGNIMINGYLANLIKKSLLMIIIYMLIHILKIQLSERKLKIVLFFLV